MNTKPVAYSGLCPSETLHVRHDGHDCIISGHTSKCDFHQNHNFVLFVLIWHFHLAFSLLAQLSLFSWLTWQPFFRERFCHVPRRRVTVGKTRAGISVELAHCQEPGSPQCPHLLPRTWGRFMPGHILHIPCVTNLHVILQGGNPEAKTCWGTTLPTCLMRISVFTKSSQVGPAVF